MKLQQVKTHTRLVLNDSTIRRLEHLPSGIPEAVFGHNSIGVDDQNKCSNAQRFAIGTPRPPFVARFRVHLVLCHLHGFVFEAFISVILDALGFELSEEFLELQREGCTSQHVNICFTQSSKKSDKPNP